jgi:hypothetical protein
MALPDTFIAHAKPGDILARHGLDGSGLAGAARDAARAANPKLAQ